jgi:hypothetical protein
MTPPRSAHLQAPTLRSALLEATATSLAAIATMLCTGLFAPGAGPAVMAVVLCISLSNSQLDRDLRGRLEAAAVLPLVGLGALGIGLLLRHLPWLGAAAFVAGMSVSIWLRRFGPAARRAGSLIALPLVALLTVPHTGSVAHGALPAFLVPIVVALLALGWVTLAHLLTRRVQRRAPFDPAGPAPDEPAPGKTQPGSQRLPPSTRMALQMAIALALAFVVGFSVFPDRWAWVVLTAFIVNSGNRGRLDVLYKSGMRIAGAAAGTVIALLFTAHALASPAIAGPLILAALFFGLWLRPFGYAWWALFVTVALALLQGFADASPAALLGQRLEEIVIGAAIGVGAAWWVLPVRSTDVLRRRLADALAALAEAVDPATPTRSPARFEAALIQVQQVLPPFRAIRLLTRRTHAMQADWADTLLACHAPAVALIERGATPGRVRQAVGAARKALREPATLQVALSEMRMALAEH